MSEYEQVINEIVKHGVVVNVKKIIDDNYIPYERKYVGCVVELDFSEHDKVFEDKIELLNRNLNLQKDKRCEVEIERNYLAERFNQLKSENDELKQRIDELEKGLEEWKAEAKESKKKRDEQLKFFRKGMEPYVDLLHTHKTIAELKQRIAELESKETSDLPFDPLECANYLINATYERKTNVIERSLASLPDVVSEDKYTIDDLEQIAEHLLVYCKHNKELE